MKSPKLFILLLFCAISCQIIFAQKTSFPEVGATWYNGWSSIGGWQSYFTVEITKDTLLMDKNCFEMQLKRYSILNEIEYIRYKYVFFDSDKIYQYHDENFYLLYDFTVNEGDTIRTTLVKDESDFYQSDNSVSLINVELEVTSVGGIEINGEILRNYSATLLGDEYSHSTPGFCIYFGGAIENVIGSYFFPIFDPFCGADDDGTFPRRFRCYINKDFQYKDPWSQMCDYTFYPSGLDEYNNQPYSIYTNPENSTLTIIGLEQYPVEYSITYTNGNTIINGKFTDNNIDISKLQPGVYILQIDTCSYKFVKK